MLDAMAIRPSFSKIDLKYFEWESGAEKAAAVSSASLRVATLASILNS